MKRLTRYPIIIRTDLWELAVVVVSLGVIGWLLGVDHHPVLSSRELALRSGQLDLIYGQADDNWIDQMSSAPNVKVDVFGVGEVSSIYFNVTKPPFDNLAVRQAVASALNRDEFLALYGKRAARQVHALFIDVNELTDRTENSLKFIGDIYASRLFGIGADRLGLATWKANVQEKLKTLDCDGIKLFVQGRFRCPNRKPI